MTNDMENLIRELVAYGDSIGRSAVDLVMSEDSAALAIIVAHLGPITASVIDDVTAAMDGDDNFNE